MRYTIDGASPAHSGTVYTSPIAIGKDAVLVQVIGEADGVKSDIEQFHIPAIEGDQHVTVDPAKPATWKRGLGATSTAETFELLSMLDQYGASLTDIRLTAEKDRHYSEWSTDTATTFAVDQVRGVADVLMTLHAGWNLRLEIAKTSYATGADLQDFVRTRKDEIKPDQLEQHG